MSEVAVPVTVRGRRGEHDVGGPALLWLADDGLVLATNALARRVVVRFDELAGVAADVVPGRAPLLTLFLGGGDVLDVEGDERLAPLALAVEPRAMAFPELTRALRAVGSARGGPGDEHDRWFAPLLEARARAEGAGGWPAQLAAFAMPALRDAWAAAQADAARRRHPTSAPDRRALEAALEESLDAATRCLARVEAAAAAVREAGDADRIARWRRWVAEVARLFTEADRCWLAALEELAAAPLPPPAPPPPTGFWRRTPGAPGGGR